MPDGDQATRTEQGLLEAFINNALVGMFTFDGSGVLKSFNPAGTKIFGYDPDEIIGERLTKLFPKIKLANTDGSQSTGQDIIEIEGAHKDGTPRILEMSLSEIQESGEQLYATIVRDVTPHHEAAKALHTSQQRLNTIMNSVGSALIGIDGTGAIRSFNLAAEKIFQYSITEANELQFSLLLEESLREEHEQNLAAFLETGQSSTIGKYREMAGLRKGGNTFPVEIWINWMEVGDEVWFLAMCRDITARKAAEQEKANLESELIQAQKMESLGVLSGGIAHEINTPVQYVGDNIRFLETSFSELQPVFEKFKSLIEAEKQQNVSPELIKETDDAVQEADVEFLLSEMPLAIEQSLEGVAQISEIVQAIKEFSHPDSKEKTVVDINHALKTTISVARNQWKYVADVETEFDDTLPSLMGLPGELNQVFLNLLGNAAHAIEDANADEETKGRIKISTRRDGENMTIEISDSGCGIPADKIEKIFDPFFTTKEPGRGTGQGLSISHNIIKNKHGGDLTVSSVVGEGTTFAISLPLNQGPQKKGAAQ